MSNRHSSSFASRRRPAQIFAACSSLRRSSGVTASRAASIVRRDFTSTNTSIRPLRTTRSISQAGVRVVYAEVPGAQHAFEIFPSLRTTLVVHGVERYLAYVYGEYLAAQRTRQAATA